MQYTKLGNSDLTVSRICMGCMGFGDAKNGQHSWTLDEEAFQRDYPQGTGTGHQFLRHSHQLSERYQRAVRRAGHLRISQRETMW